MSPGWDRTLLGRCRARWTTVQGGMRAGVHDDSVQASIAPLPFRLNRVSRHHDRPADVARAPLRADLAPPDATAAALGFFRRAWVIRTLSILFVLGLWEWAGRIPVSPTFPTFLETLRRCSA